LEKPRSSLTLKGVWRDEVQCRVVNLSYDFVKREGVLVTEEDTCDMDGTIALFERIDPKVKVIATFVGEVRDSSYVRKRRGWGAIRPSSLAKE
jgi:hypothetical protein